MVIVGVGVGPGPPYNEVERTRRAGEDLYCGLLDKDHIGPTAGEYEGHIGRRAGSGFDPNRCTLNGRAVATAGSNYRVRMHACVHVYARRGR